MRAVEAQIPDAQLNDLWEKRNESLRHDQIQVDCYKKPLLTGKCAERSEGRLRSNDEVARQGPRFLV